MPLLAHRPRKRFGQHFLHERYFIERIIAAIDPQPGERIVEIGPGLGALTQPLLGKVEHLDVVEIDRDIIARLREQYPPQRLAIHEGDALQFDFAALGSELRIVGNLPYNISTPLLFHLAAAAVHVRDMTFMLQQEVVERMLATPGSKTYGRLSVMLQVKFAMEKLLSVPAGAFRPPPKVESAVVRMRPLGSASPAIDDEALFAHLVTSAFSQRRKMLRQSLKTMLAAADFAAASIDASTRAEQLSTDDFVRLANHLARRSTTNSRPNPQ